MKNSVLLIFSELEENFHSTRKGDLLRDSHLYSYKAFDDGFWEIVSSSSVDHDEIE